ncbi:MAG: AAA family ATPase [Geminicoccaceae bacterium]|nr:AAA family ATPase [Geminicoccaceae bacterium]
MKISIPDFSLVVLIGPTGSGKSSFARRHFCETEIISSDACRAVVSDDETDQSATSDAFELLHLTAGSRLRRRKLTVIDATSVQQRDRAELVQLARQYHALPVVLALNIDPELCHERNKDRSNRDFSADVPRKHAQALRLGLRGLKKEGFRQIQIMNSPAEVDALERFAKRQQMRWSKRGAHLLLQTRTRVLDGTLRTKFEEWYPGLVVNAPNQQPEPMQMAA